MRRAAVGRRHGILEPAHNDYGDWWSGLDGADGDVAWGWQPYGTSSDGDGEDSYGLYEDWYDPYNGT